MARPMPEPISGSLLAPKITRTMAKIIINSGIPIPNMLPPHLEYTAQRCVGYYNLHFYALCSHNATKSRAFRKGKNDCQKKKGLLYNIFLLLTDPLGVALLTNWIL